MSGITAMGGRLLSLFVPTEVAHAQSGAPEHCWIERTVCLDDCSFWYWRREFHWRCDSGRTWVEQEPCMTADDC